MLRKTLVWFVGLVTLFIYSFSAQITFADESIQNISLKSLHDHIGFVAQDPFLFDGTIRDNLILGKPSANQFEINETEHCEQNTIALNLICYWFCCDISLRECYWPQKMAKYVEKLTFIKDFLKMKFGFPIPKLCHPSNQFIQLFIAIWQEWLLKTMEKFWRMTKCLKSWVKLHFDIIVP